MTLADAKSALTAEAAAAHYHYNKLSAVINSIYAHRHGYGHKYIRLALHDKHGRTWNNKQAMCQHPIHGPRVAPWCKLLAVCEPPQPPP